MAPSLKARLVANVRRIKPALIFRLAFTILYLLPGFVVAMAQSWPKMNRWRRVKRCRAFVDAHPEAFAGVDADTLEIRPLCGGVSNSNQVWRFRRHNGGVVDFFVKVFLPVGSYWARNLCRLSPFPKVASGAVSERFEIDRKTRRWLAASRVPVPRVVAYDNREEVLVTEFVSGVNVDEALKAAAARGHFTDVDREMIRRCASELATAHSTGFSLVDTQPVNCLWDEKELKVFFTDLEFSTREDKSAWDAGFFLMFLCLRLVDGMKSEATALFLENYRRIRPLRAAELKVTADNLEDYVPLMQMILDARQFTPEELVQELAR